MAGPLLVWGLAAIVTFLAMLRRVDLFDEGIILSGAMRLLDGQVVHRDFYSTYGPGTDVAMATLFTVFGPSFFVARLFVCLAMASIVALSFVLLRLRVPVMMAIIASLVIMSWMMTLLVYPYVIYLCLVFALASAWVLTRPQALTNKRAMITAGAFAGVTAYLRYDTGFMLAVAQALAVTVTQLRFQPNRHGAIAATRMVLFLAIGACAIFSIGAIAYLLVSPFAAFRADIIDYTMHYYNRGRRLPFPRLHDMKHAGNWIAYLPLVIAASSFGAVKNHLSQGAKDYQNKGISTLPISLILTCLTLLFFLKGVVRVSGIQMTLSLVPAVILAAIVIYQWWLSGPRLAAAIGALIIVTPIASSALYFVVLVQVVPAITMGGEMAAKAGVIAPAPNDITEICPPSPNARWAWLPPAHARAAYYLARRTRPDDRILVGVDHHDQYVTNALAMYFVTNRLPSTHWSEYDPGIQNTAPIQRAMIGELERGRVPFIVRDASYDHIKEPNDSAISSGVHLLDTYIDAHYRAVAQSPGIEIWARNGLPVSPIASDPAPCRMQEPGADMGSTSHISS